MSEYYDKDGEQITMQEWGQLLNNYDYKVIKKTKISEDKLISTVWLGLNHSFLSDTPPLIFETMVFSNDEDDGDMDRYHTLEEAQAGHEAFVKKYTPGFWKNLWKKLRFIK